MVLGGAVGRGETSGRVGKKVAFFIHPLPPLVLWIKTKKTRIRGKGPIAFPADPDYSILLFFAVSHF